MKNINVAPSAEDEDPLYGFHRYAILFASGTLPVPHDVYTHLVSAKLVALGKTITGKPTTTGWYITS
jgi:hypothetical protein